MSRIGPEYDDQNDDNCFQRLFLSPHLMSLNIYGKFLNADFKVNIQVLHQSQNSKIFFLMNTPYSVSLKHDSWHSVDKGLSYSLLDTLILVEVFLILSTPFQDFKFPEYMIQLFIFFFFVLNTGICVQSSRSTGLKPGQQNVVHYIPHKKTFKIKPQSLTLSIVHSVLKWDTFFAGLLIERLLFDIKSLRLKGSP